MATTRRRGNFKGGRLIASSGYWIVYVGKGIETIKALKERIATLEHHAQWRNGTN